MIDKWRLLLQEVQRSTSSTGSSGGGSSGGSSGSDSRGRVDTAIAAVRSSDEYTRFVEMHKTPPPPAVQFGFEVSTTATAAATVAGAGSSASGLPGGSIQELDPNGIVLNESTADNLRARLQENEVKLAECRWGWGSEHLSWIYSR